MSLQDKINQCEADIQKLQEEKRRLEMMMQARLTKITCEDQTIECTIRLDGRAVVSAHCKGHFSINKSEIEKRGFRVDIF